VGRRRRRRRRSRRIMGADRETGVLWTGEGSGRGERSPSGRKLPTYLSSLDEADKPISPRRERERKREWGI
jgi:hypothetical protein